MNWKKLLNGANFDPPTKPSSYINSRVGETPELGIHYCSTAAHSHLNSASKRLIHVNRLVMGRSNDNMGSKKMGMNNECTDTRASGECAWLNACM